MNTFQATKRGLPASDEEGGYSTNEPSTSTIGDPELRHAAGVRWSDDGDETELVIERHSMPQKGWKSCPLSFFYLSVTMIQSQS